MRIFLLAAALAALAAPADALPVRAWTGAETISTYEEGPPDPNPPFDLLAVGRFNYPYTVRENLTDRRAPRVWRTLNLENEHLRVTVLPDLGGRLWRCVDKANGAQMFYANPSLKFANVAYRGAWATFGIEFNFPVSHNWVTSSPVDHALVREPDGSASIVVGNVDLVYGMQWRVALTLRPGRAALEQRTTLYNRSDVRHRYYWWTNAAVQVWDDSDILYPMKVTASHASAVLDQWPVDSQGTDLRHPGQLLKGPVSLFSYGDREAFMGVYHPRTRAGVVHVASASELPGKKVWSWGADAEGRDWRRALSDNESAEIEVQAGLFQNQETYAFLEPQASVDFRELWLPLREIGGFSRATEDAIVRLAREEDTGKGATAVVGLQVTAALRGGRLVLRNDTRVLADVAVDLTPAETWRRTFAVTAKDAGALSVELRDAGGQVLVAHTEGRYDVREPASVTLGPQTAPVPPPREEWTEGDFLAQGRAQELEGKLLRAYAGYEQARARFPTSAALAKAQGRLAVDLLRFGEAVPLLVHALAAESTDAETSYLLGEAYAALGEERKAELAWENAALRGPTRGAALLGLAQLRARAGDDAGALQRLRAGLRLQPGMVRAGALEVALLRRTGRKAEARTRLAHWRRVDPTSSFLRHEAVRLGAVDEALWRHLAADPQRVLDVATDYMAIGAFDEALAVLSRTYPSGAGVVAEPGAVLPQEHAEVAYYRAFCKARLGQPAVADLAAASRLSTRYVFPHRAATLAVLQEAVRLAPGDATAHFLVGELHVSSGLTREAIASWETSRRLDPRRPGLHRDLGLVLVQTGEYARAEEVLTEGIGADPENVEVYQALDQVLGLLARPPAERVAALSRYPRPASMPPSLVMKSALALVEASRFDEAEALLHGRFFPREEFGTNVREVFLEIRLQKALALARAGTGAEAVRLVRTLGEAVPDLPFTRDGLEPFLQSARTRYLQGLVLAAAGDDAGARQAWEDAARGGDRYPHPDAAYAYRAAERLGRSREARALVEAALASWRNRLLVGTNYPGANTAGQAYFLSILGRDDEARQKSREALLLPDKMMSHYLSRLALAPLPPW